MTPTPIALLEKAIDLGLKLGSEGRHTLTVEPSRRCPRAFADTLKDHKWLLLDLLRLPFVMVFSKALGETIFFCEDEGTKGALVEAGADQWSIYTREELKVLVEQNRVAPLSQADLKKVHEIKRNFDVRITPRNELGKQRSA
jgi:hypothetical protein